MSAVLVIAEHDGEKILPSTAKAVACALELQRAAVDVAVLSGEGGETLAAQAARIGGVTRVRLVARAENRHPVAAVLAPQVAALASEYTHVLAPSTTFGKDLMPRAAALLATGQVSDIMSVDGPYRFKRPTYAGNAIETVDCPSDGVVIGTVRIASYRAPAGAESEAPIDTDSLDLELPSHTRFVELKAQVSDRPDLQTAARVVAGGRAFGSAENFELVGRLAQRLGAAVGASRAAVDAGYASNDLQVGQTGKVIAPDLYIALGISGAIQHITGIKDARTIVAVNKDADAPIFDIADIGLVADVFSAVPELIAALDDD